MLIAIQTTILVEKSFTEVLMLKRQSRHVAMSLCLCIPMLSIPSHAVPSTSNDNLDHVLSELSRQHSNASDLVKSARQPLGSEPALVLNSQLLNKIPQDTNTQQDVLERLSALASTTVSKFSQTGIASWYGRQFHGKKTASGDIFDPNALTAAHRSLPMNCYIKVTNKSNGKSVIVKVNDRGPFSSNRVVDLSYAAAKQIGIVNSGTGNVVIERVANPS